MDTIKNISDSRTPILTVFGTLGSYGLLVGYVYDRSFPYPN